MATIARVAPLSRRALACPSPSTLNVLRPASTVAPLQSVSQTPGRALPALKPRIQHATPKRQYHSPLHPRLPPHEYTNSQTAILTAALQHIPTHGFSTTALTLGAHDAGFLDVSIQLLPRGEFDLILFWLASRRGLLRAQVEEAALFNRAAADRGLAPQDLSVDDKTRILVLERLRLNKDIKEHWQDALAQMSLLGNIPLSLAELHALSNDILSLAGDRSVDASWYTRRAAVAGIYASAEVVMTRDQTEDLRETESFVERRFEDRHALKLKVDAVSQCISFWGNSVVGVGRSFGLKV